MLWTFSIILESVCVLPQLLLLRQTTVPTVIDSFYLVMLGSYRAFYILNWVVRVATEDGYWDPISWIFGVVQTAMYLDFAWVYWTRQRVKLRAGGIVDSEDLSRGWLVTRLIGRERLDLEDEEGRPAANPNQPAHDPSNGSPRSSIRKPHNKWGPRGISVSADDELVEEGTKKPDAKTAAGDGSTNHTQKDDDGLADPSAFEDDFDATEERQAWNHETSAILARGWSAYGQYSEIQHNPLNA
jgi:ER lumen protein retaining receptor